MPILKKVRVLAAAVETAIGSPVAGMDATDCKWNAFDIEIQPTIEFIQRPMQKSFSQLPGVIGTQMGTATFKTELGGPATGPDWADVLFPACGYTEKTPLVWSPKSAAPQPEDVGPPDTTGTTFNHTITIEVFEDGLKKSISGAMGTFRMAATIGKQIILEWTFTGLWQPPIDATILAPTFPTELPYRFGSSTITVGGSSPGCIEAFMIDAGNNVIMRECHTASSGYSSALITDRRVIGSFNPESKIVGTKDEHALWLAGTEEALVMVFADTVDKVTINVPKCQRYNIQEGDRNGLQTDQIEWQANGTAGDEEMTITFAAV